MNDEQVMHALSIDDVYDVERVLARGKTGTTELVTAKGSGPFVRKKMARELVRRGVWSALLDCDCPRLPRIEATYQMPDEFVVVYDFIPGKNLQELVAERGRLPEDEAVALALDICEAASAIHALGVIHRDITPKNVIVSGDGAHLIDFGIARMYTEGASRDTTTLGTFGFASPEQYGFEQTDARSDVYSIGRVLGYLLTGVMPNDESYREVLADESAVSARMRAIVERACAMEPSARYQSAGDFAAALRGEKDAEAAARAAMADAESSAASGKGAVISQRFGRFRGVKSRKSDGTPDGGATGGRTSRRPKWVVVLAEVMLALAMLATLLVFLARNGVIPQWGAVGSGPTPTWGGGGTVTSSSNGSAASGASASSSTATVDGILQIGEVGWHSEVGFITVTYSVTNTSQDQLVTSSTITLTARAEDGSVLGVGKDHPTIFPGQTIWGSAVVGEGTRVGSVEAVASPVYASNLVDASPDDASVFSVKDARVKWTPGLMEALGEITCQKRGRFAQGMMKVIVVFKDAGGAVVGSLETDIDYPSEDGGTVPFDMSAVYVPDYDSYEVCVYDD